jgi:hypothetical protein
VCFYEMLGKLDVPVIGGRGCDQMELLGCEYSQSTV